MRICFVVLTCEKYSNTRVLWLKETVFKNVSPQDVYFLGNRMDENQRMFSWGAPDDYNSCPVKYLHCFLYSDLGTKNYDWFFFMDDDTFVYIDRLKNHLRKYDPTEPIMDGRLLDHVRHTQWGIYHSGGAGISMTAPVFHFLEKFLKQKPFGYDPPHWCGDICIGYWTRFFVKQNHDAFHPDMYDPQKHNMESAITFHYLRKREDYLFLAERSTQN